MHENTDLATDLTMAAVVAANRLLGASPLEDQVVDAIEAAIRDALDKAGVTALASENGLFVKAMQAIEKAHRTRLRFASASMVLADAERFLKLQEALAQQRAIEAAGGEKALGTNQAARDRALRIALAEDEGYRQAQELYRSAYLEARKAEADMLAEVERLKVLRTALTGNRN